MKTLSAATLAGLAGIAGIAAWAAPAAAQDDPGKLQVKLLGTAVLPDGKIADVNVDIVPLPAGTQTAANDNVVPTIAIEYFFTDSLSLETICCVTQHDVDATAGLPGAELVADAQVIPATFTLKYHFNAGGIKPYLGAGATYFLWIKDKPGAATIPLGVTDTDLSDEFGLVLQGGVDIPLGGKGFGFSLDAKKYFVGTTARWYVGNTLAIENEHDLDPWVLSAGVSYRF
jgi:outer membrane protein